MKKIFLLIAFCAFTATSYAQSARTTDNHSLSTSTLLSLEYAYEKALGEHSTIVLRAGLPNRVLYDSYLSKHSLNLNGRATLAYGITIEPRFYTNLDKRAKWGENTSNNSANFFAVRLQGTLGTPNYPTAEVCLVPMYGIRRVWGDHWFGEFTVGGGISCHSLHDWSLNLKPHLQYRIGWVF